MGPPGSGKGTLATRLSQIIDISVIATGDELRNQLAAGTALGKKAKEFMNAGKLVPNEVIMEMVRELFQKSDLTNGFLLDGFPRTIAQAEMLEEFLDEKDMGLEKVFFLVIPKDVLIDRLSSRRVCVHCGLTHSISGHTTDEEMICVECNSELVQRDDDLPEVIEKRIDVYNEQTKPLVDHYKEKGILYEIDGGIDGVEIKANMIVDAIKAI